MAHGQRGPGGHRASALLHAYGGGARQRERDVLPHGAVRHISQRGRDARHPYEMVRCPGRRPPRHMDRSHECQSHGRGPRSRCLDLAQARRRADVGLHPSSDRPDVPRDGRQPDPVLRVRQPRGRPGVPRPKQQPAWRVGGRPHVSLRQRRRPPYPARHVAHHQQRRERVGHARPGRSEHHLVNRFRRGQCRRRRPTLRGTQASVPQRRSVAGSGEWAPGRLEVPLQLDHAVHDLAARSPQALCGEPARPPDDRRWAELASDQPGPHAQRQEPATKLGRDHPGEQRRRLYRGHRDRGIAPRTGAHLGLVPTTAWSTSRATVGSRGPT